MLISITCRFPVHLENISDMNSFLLCKGKSTSPPPPYGSIYWCVCEVNILHVIICQEEGLDCQATYLVHRYYVEKYIHALIVICGK